MAKILLVEDNEMNRNMLSRRLTQLGFTIVTAICCLIVAGIPIPATGQSPATPPVSRVSRDSAHALPSLHLRGIVVYAGGANELFVQVGTETLSVDATLPAGLTIGDRVDIAGVVTEQNGRRRLTAASVTPAGRAALPPARHISSATLTIEHGTNDWVGFDAVVQDMSPAAMGAELYIATESWLPVSAAVLSLGLDRDTMIDAVVHIRGVRTLIRNQQGSVIAVRIFMPSLTPADVQHPAPAKPFELPLQSIAEARKMTLRQQTLHRIRVRGTVVLKHPTQLPGRYMAHVQDSTGAIPVDLSMATEVTVGDSVEVAGFPMTVAGVPFLSSNLVKRLGRSDLPAPAALPIAQVIAGNYAGRLIKLRGTFTRFTAAPGAQIAEINSNGMTISAYLYDWPKHEPLPTLRADSVVDLTGIATVFYDAASLPQLVVMTLIGPQGISVVSVPSWWTPLRLAMMAACGGGVCLLSFVWIIVLNQRVRQRTKALTVMNETLEIRVRERSESMRAAKDMAEQANKAKSVFLANMSHELRTPLNAIIGYSEMLEEDALASGRMADIEDLRKIHASGRHLLSLISEILDFSKIEAGKVQLLVESFDMADVVKDVVATIEMMASKNGNTLTVAMEESIPMVSDRTKIYQILLNLASNACKFTESGAISIDIRRQEDRDDYIQIRVSDTGIGISPDLMARLFEPFMQADSSTTRKFGGTGLGLVISRKFCQLLGGDIDAASVLGQGATFTALIPMTIAQTDAANPGPVDLHSERTSSHPEQSGSRTVLVIDDDPAGRELICRALHKEGCHVISCRNASEGLAQAHKVKPDVITLDIIMKGLDGWTALKTIKSDSDLATIPVIVITVTDEPEKALKLGAQMYLRKPIRQDLLAAALKQCEAARLTKPQATAQEIEAQECLSHT